MLFAGAGYSVNMYDVNEELVQNAIKDIESQFQLLSSTGMLRGSQPPEEQLKLIKSWLTCPISHIVQ